MTVPAPNARVFMGLSKSDQCGEQELLQELEAAIARYRAASERMRSVVHAYGNLLDIPQGASVVHQAACAEMDAVQQYAATLKAWADFIRHRNSPLPSLLPAQAA